MIRSVTFAILGSSLVMPVNLVALSECNSCRRAPASGAIGFGCESGFGPCRANTINPLPLRLNLVPAHEQRRVAVNQVEQQPLIGNAAAMVGKGVGQADIERHLAQADAFAV